MNISEKYRDFEFQLLDSIAKSGESLTKIIAECLGNHLFQDVKLRFRIDRDRFDFHYDSDSHTESSDYNITRVSSEKLSQNRKRIFSVCPNKLEDDDFLMAYNIKNNRFMICFNPLEHESIFIAIAGRGTAKNIKTAHEFVNNSDIATRFVFLVNALVMQRTMGDITFLIHHFTQNHEQKLSLENLHLCHQYIKRINSLQPSTRKTNLLDYIIVFLYNSTIVDQRRNDLVKNSKKGVIRLDLIFDLLALATDTITLNFPLDPQNAELSYCLLCLLDVMYGIHSQRLSETVSFRNGKQDILTYKRKIFDSKVEIYKRIDLNLNNKPRLYKLVRLLVVSNHVVYSIDNNSPIQRIKKLTKLAQAFLPYIIRYFNNIYIHNIESKLEKSQVAGNNSSRLILNRHVLRLMFIYHAFTWERVTILLESMTKGELTKFTHSLAYVIQETLRYLGMDEMPFTTRPMHFASCMLDIISVHAEKVHNVKLPDYLVKKLYEMTTQTEISKQQTQLEKLEHVISLYIGGFVLGKIAISPNSLDMFSMISNNNLTLVNAPVEKSNTKIFKKCLIFATLFHDFAMDDTIVGTRQEYDAALNELFTQDILNKIEHKDLFEADFEQNFHSVMGSKTVLEHLFRQNTKYKNAQDERNCIGLKYALDREDVIKPVIRAILFHNASHNMSDIGKSKEPLTTYLSLLDEIFDWEPSFNYDPQPTKSTLVHNDFSVADFRQQQISPEIGIILENTLWISRKNINYPAQDIFDLDILKALTKGPIPLPEPEFSHSVLTKFDSTLSSNNSGKSKVQGLPYFSLYLGKNRYAIHKMHTILLKKAQNFGRFSDREIKLELSNDKRVIVTWSPRINLKYVGEYFDASKILDNIDRHMLSIDTDISSLVHDFILAISKQQDIDNKGILLGELKNPFANIDIRICFKDLEDKVLGVHCDDEVSNQY